MVILSGPDAKSHDWAEGQGSFAKALENIREGAITPVTRSNMRLLVPIARRVSREGASRWRLLCVGFGEDPDPRCPRLVMAIPRVLHACAVAEKSGITVELEGFPVCLLGPWARIATHTTERSFAPGCASCTLRDECPGADAAYLKRYGDAELSPRTGAISSQPKRRK